jgi:predicted LPLAT superfamily acyltransferase
LAGDAKSEAEVLAWIQQDDEKRKPTTRSEIRHCRSMKFNKKMTKGCGDSFIGRHLTELIETTMTPKEEPRAEIPRIFLDETRQAMKEAVHLRPPDLVFNLDEVKISGGKIADQSRSCFSIGSS